VAEAFLFGPPLVCCPKSPEAPDPVVDAAITEAVLCVAAAGSMVIDEVEETGRVDTLESP
jgi:hypothetical protein